MEMEVYDGNTGEIQPVEVELSALETMTRSEIDVAIATAKRYPRSIEKSLKRVKTMALASPEIAESCFYTLPGRQGGKVDANGKLLPIIGPNARLAEMLASAWGNIRTVARITQEGKHFIVAQAVVQDLESNNMKVVEERRSIWGRHGRYKEEMIGRTAGAACSIAARNAIFAVIPRALWWDVYLACRRVAAGEGMSIEDAREKNIEWAASLGVSAKEVFAFLGINGLADMTFEHLETLAGVRSAIKDNETTVGDVFRPQSEMQPQAVSQPVAKIEQMKSRMKSSDKSKSAAVPDDETGWQEGRE